MDIVSTSWTAFSRFMAANGREILTSVAVLTSGCFLLAIVYFLYRFMGIIHWRKALNWRNWTLKNLLRSEKNEKVDEDDDEGEDDDDDEDEGDEEADDEENDDDDDEDRRNRHSEAMEAISKLSDEDIKPSP
ncbi:hypothetical protein TYRP_006024 [Tyrophagus putrescentiae]|nr:hypothetical protein TYRP_006024 [Tyrophagus putrescentiae]